MSSKREVCSSDLTASKVETVGMSSVMEILANDLTSPEKKEKHKNRCHKAVIHDFHTKLCGYAVS